MYSYYGGIDPGKYGGLAVISSIGLVCNVAKMPRRLTAIEEYMSSTMAWYRENLLVGLEVPSPVRYQGLKSTVTQWRHIGNLEGLLRALNLEFRCIDPNVWKPAMSVTGDKETSIRLAHELFPRDATYTDGEAEALLIAEYMRRVDA